MHSCPSLLLTVQDHKRGLAILQIQMHNTAVLPANNHSTEHRSPASIQHVMSEVVCVSDVNPERKDEKETQADDGCNPVMRATFSICQKKEKRNKNKLF